jgi:hypothetical protein
VVEGDKIRNRADETLPPLRTRRASQAAEEGGAMTDLEMVRLCAEAMGYIPFGPADTPHGQVWLTKVAGEVYDPLHDDAQAMALVKKFGLSIAPELGQGRGLWRVNHWRDPPLVLDTDLNRAIVECVAKMQKAKVAT